MKRVSIFPLFLIFSVSFLLIFSANLLAVTKSLPKAIVIGASSGIGKSIAKKLAQNGYDVGLASRKAEKLKLTAQEIEENFIQEINKFLPQTDLTQTQTQLIQQPKTYIKQIDVTKTQEAREKLAELVTEMGGLDLIVISISSFEEIFTGKANRESTIDVDLKGFWTMADVAKEFFEKQKHGHLVGISSIEAIRGNALCPEYSGSKAFMSTYLEGIRNYFIQNKIPVYVTEIIPGWVDADHTQFSQMPDTYWVAPLKKATDQIYEAIQNKKKKSCITKRWELIKILLEWLPDCIYNADWWKIR